MYLYNGQKCTIIHDCPCFGYNTLTNIKISQNYKTYIYIYLIINRQIGKKD